jgi:NADH:ubiquinone oxidoreductase subunit E
MPQTKEMHICLGSSCFSRGNKDVAMFIRDYLKRNHLDEKVVFRGSRCMGHCSNGPNMRINEIIVEEVTISKIESILEDELSKLK